MSINSCMTSDSIRLMNLLCCADVSWATKRRQLNETHKYLNFDFILGSASEVERLWSVANNILTDNRKSMTPILFENLLLLKINKGYWDLENMCEAMKKARSDKVHARLQEDVDSSAM